MHILHTKEMWNYRNFWMSGKKNTRKSTVELFQFFYVVQNWRMYYRMIYSGNT